MQELFLFAKINQFPVSMHLIEMERFFLSPWIVGGEQRQVKLYFRSIVFTNGRCYKDVQVGLNQFWMILQAEP